MRPTEEDKMLHFQKVMNFMDNDRKGEKRFCNKTLSSQGENFPIHDCVVASMSDYFNALFGVEMREKYSQVIELNRIPPKRLGNVINYIYTGDIEVTEDNVGDLLQDADYTQMTDLKTFCSRTILKIISVDNCLKLRAHACRYNLANVEQKTNQMIVENFKTVVQQKDFMLLDAGEMSAIMKQKDIKDTEAMFTGIVRWVKFNPSLREELFVELFSQLDLSTISTHFLKTTMNIEPLVRSHVECCHAVMDAAFASLDVKTPGTSGVQQDLSGFFVIGCGDSERDCVKWNVKTKKHQHLPKLNTGRKWSTSARPNNNVYVMGGVGPIKSCEMMDLNENKRWIEIADLPEARSSAASSVQGQINLTGGFGERGPFSSCLVYDHDKDNWMKSFDMLQPRCEHGMCSIYSSIYCIAGDEGKQILKSCEHRDVRSSTSSNIASLKQARSAFACVETGGKIYAIGGSFDWRNTLQTVEEYEPRTNKWRNVSPLIIPRYNHSACVVHGRIYVVGGQRRIKGKFESLNSVEVYDPTSDAWTHCFDLDEPVYGATVVAV